MKFPKCIRVGIRLQLIILVSIVTLVSLVFLAVITGSYFTSNFLSLRSERLLVIAKLKLSQIEQNLQLIYYQLYWVSTRDQVQSYVALILDYGEAVNTTDQIYALAGPALDYLQKFIDSSDTYIQAKLYDLRLQEIGLVSNNALLYLTSTASAAATTATLASQNPYGDALNDSIVGLYLAQLLQELFILSPNVTSLPLSIIKSGIITGPVKDAALMRFIMLMTLPIYPNLTVLLSLSAIVGYVSIAYNAEALKAVVYDTSAVDNGKILLLQAGYNSSLARYPSNDNSTHLDKKNANSQIRGISRLRGRSDPSETSYPLYKRAGAELSSSTNTGFPGLVISTLSLKDGYSATSKSSSSSPSSSLSITSSSAVSSSSSSSTYAPVVTYTLDIANLTVLVLNGLYPTNTSNCDAGETCASIPKSVVQDYYAQNYVNYLKYVFPPTNSSPGSMLDTFYKILSFPVLVNCLVNGASGTRRNVKTLDGNKMAVGYAKIDLNIVDWAVFVEQDSLVFMGPSKHLINIIVGTVIGVCSFMCILTFPISHYAVQPITRLKEKSEEFSLRRGENLKSAMHEDDRATVGRHSSLSSKMYRSTKFTEYLAVGRLLQRKLEERRHKRKRESEDAQIISNGESNTDSSRTAANNSSTPSSHENSYLKSSGFRTQSNSPEISKKSQLQFAEDTILGTHSSEKNLERRSKQKTNLDVKKEQDISVLGGLPYSQEDLGLDESRMTTHPNRSAHTFLQSHMEDRRKYGILNPKRYFIVNDELTELTHTFESMNVLIKQQYGDLEAKVRERTRELENAKIVAERANESKSLFIANISHELRTPLNGIVGMCSIAMEELRHLQEPTTASNSDIVPQKITSLITLLQIMNKSGELLTHMLNELLTFLKNSLNRTRLETRRFLLTDSMIHIKSIFMKNSADQEVSFLVSFLGPYSQENMVSNSVFKDSQIGNLDTILQSVINDLAIRKLRNFVLEADDNRILQVLMNLVSNLLKFTPVNGEIKLQVQILGEWDEEKSKQCDYSEVFVKEVSDLDEGYMEPEELDPELEGLLEATKDRACNRGEHEPEIKVRVRSPPKYWVFEMSVSDNGLGILPELQPQVFEPFVQGDQTLSRLHGGTGLGLSICKQLVELMRGKILLESTLGKGTRFSFRVPLKQTEELVWCNKDDESAAFAGEFDQVMSRNTSIVSPLQKEVSPPADGERNVRPLPSVSSFSSIKRNGSIKSKKGDSVRFNLDKPSFVTASSTGTAHSKGAAGSPGVVTSDPFSRLEERAASTTEVETLRPRFLDTGRSYLSGSVMSGRRGLKLLGERFPLRILVAEDNLVNQTVASKMLKLEGYEDVSLACDGAEAISLVEQSISEYEQKLEKSEDTSSIMYDMILMDVQMPRVDGLKATKYIRENLCYRGPIVALTAFTDSSNVNNCLECGMDDFLPKPIRRELLRKLIIKHLKSLGGDVELALETR